MRSNLCWEVGLCGKVKPSSFSFSRSGHICHLHTVLRLAHVFGLQFGAHFPRTCATARRTALAESGSVRCRNYLQPRRTALAYYNSLTERWRDSNCTSLYGPWPRLGSVIAQLNILPSGERNRGGRLGSRSREAAHCRFATQSFAGSCPRDVREERQRRQQSLAMPPRKTREAAALERRFWPHIDDGD